MELKFISLPSGLLGIWINKSQIPKDYKLISIFKF